MKNDKKRNISEERVKELHLKVKSGKIFFPIPPLMQDKKISFESFCPKCMTKIMTKEGYFTCLAVFHNVTKDREDKGYCQMDS